MNKMIECLCLRILAKNDHVQEMEQVEGDVCTCDLRS